MLLAAIGSFAYFILWVFFTPFLELAWRGQELVPPASVGHTGFISALVGAIVVYGVSVGMLLMQDRLPRIERCR